MSSVKKYSFSSKKPLRQSDFQLFFDLARLASRVFVRGGVVKILKVIRQKRDVVTHLVFSKP